MYEEGILGMLFAAARGHAEVVQLVLALFLLYSLAYVGGAAAPRRAR